MKLSNKQKRALKITRWFSPSWCDWSDKRDLKNLRRNVMGFGQVKYKWNAPCASVAYFAYTDKGIVPTEVNHIGRLLRLIEGHRWMGIQKSMWREGMPRVENQNGINGINLPSCLDEMPEYIKLIAAPYFL